MATDAPAPAEPRVKPTKPDEEAYKVNLAQAEKEHSAAQEKLVCITIPLFVTSILALRSRLRHNVFNPDSRGNGVLVPHYCLFES